MITRHWTEPFVADPDTCILLHRLGFPQQGTTFVWVDFGILNAGGDMNLHLMRRLDAEPGGHRYVFAAHTAEEYQITLPHNFLPMFTGKSWIITDAYGTKMHDGKEQGVNTTQVVLSRVNGSGAPSAAQAFAQAAVMLIRSGAIVFKK